MNVRKFKALASLFCLLLTSATGQQRQIELPIFLEDSHAGSFYWIAENVPLDSEYTLVLYDAHSDASQVFESDQVREALREPQTLDELRQLTRAWRKAGTIQCFNWIEPLMPNPIAEVVWVAPGDLDGSRRKAMREEIDQQINAHEIVAPRKVGNLASRFHIASIQELESRDFNRPVIVSLDLDFFMDGGELEPVWNQILSIPNLCAITAAISTPYLKSLQQAEELATKFYTAAERIENGRIDYDPAASTGPDRSRKARELISKGQEIPTYRLNPGPAPELLVAGQSADEDGTYRLKSDSGFQVRVREDVEDIQWLALPFDSDSYNFIGPDTQFAKGAPWIQRLVEHPVARNRNWIDYRDIRPFLDQATGLGTIRIQARLGESKTLTQPVILRISKSGGFRASIEESFNLPYVLGSSLRKGGPDCAAGGDCANLMVYALRCSQNRSIPWSIPRQFSRLCQPVRQFLPGAEANGVFVDFGNHLAAVWKDTEPLGELNDSDLLVHQLEGLAEIKSLQQLAVGRQAPVLLQLKSAANAITLVFGGDVMLARGVGEKIRASAIYDPFAHVVTELKNADLAVVNLECALTEPRPAPDKPYIFQANPKAADKLVAAGIDAVSLANNHSYDGGPEGFRRTQEVLREAGIECFGSEKVCIQEINGIRIALVGITSRDDIPVLRQVADKVDFTVVMPHWGLEHTREINLNQRSFARELVDAGADLIVGTGPHAPQPADRIGRIPVFYSTGNLVFDGDGPGPDWRKGYLVKVEVDERGELVSARRIAYRIPK